MRDGVRVWVEEMERRLMKKERVNDTCCGPEDEEEEREESYYLRGTLMFGDGPLQCCLSAARYNLHIWRECIIRTWPQFTIQHAMWMDPKDLLQQSLWDREDCNEKRREDQSPLNYTQPFNVPLSNVPLSQFPLDRTKRSITELWLPVCDNFMQSACKWYMLITTRLVHVKLYYEKGRAVHTRLRLWNFLKSVQNL